MYSVCSAFLGVDYATVAYWSEKKKDKEHVITPHASVLVMIWLIAVNYDFVAAGYVID